MTISWSNRVWLREEVTQARAFGEGYSEEEGCRQAPEESVVLGVLFVCLIAC